MLAHADAGAPILAWQAIGFSVLFGGFAHLRYSRRRWPLWAWLGGLAATFAAVTGPLEEMSDQSFTWHMGQHLVMMVLAAPLLVFGWPPFHRLLRLQRFTSPSRYLAPRTRARIRSALPVVTAAAFVAVLIATHLTGMYDLALRNQLVHDIEHLLYLGVAVSLWAAVTGPANRESWSRVAAVFGVGAGTAVLGLVLTSASTPLYATYVAVLGDAALSDQRNAAAFMWVAGMALTLPLLVMAVWTWASSDQRATLRREQLTDRPGHH